MSKKQKRIRVPAFKTGIVASGNHETAKPGHELPWEGEYILQQYYTITVDERFIETEWTSQFSGQDLDLQEDIERFKRMLQGITQDGKAFHAICDYLVLVNQDDSYVREHYGCDKNFIDILQEHDSCLTSKDRDWLSSLIHSHEAGEEFDLSLQLEGLEEAFQIKPSGFNVGQHACDII